MNGMTDNNNIICPNCGNTENINMQVFQENIGETTIEKKKMSFKQKGHGLLWWLFVSWWWIPIDFILWIFLFPIRLILQLFKKKKYKGKSTTTSQTIKEIQYKKVCTCPKCQHIWYIDINM